MNPSADICVWRSLNTIGFLIGVLVVLMALTGCTTMKNPLIGEYTSTKDVHVKATGVVIKPDGTFEAKEIEVNGSASPVVDAYGDFAGTVTSAAVKTGIETSVSTLVPGK